jgi:hypothetical protein
MPINAATLLWLCLAMNEKNEWMMKWMMINDGVIIE